MYRVELKVAWHHMGQMGDGQFLMYRVELKEPSGKSPIGLFLVAVPNVPCGVESLLGVLLG